MRVRIYRNLHNKKYSIQAQNESGVWRVIAHAERVSVSNAGTYVSQAGRLRVIREKRKNVHAFITGTLIHFDGLTTGASATLSEDNIRELKACRYEWRTIPQLDYVVSYNPYKYETFMIGQYGLPAIAPVGETIPGIVVCIPSGIFATIEKKG